MDNITLLTKLGEGSFATVYKGKVRGSDSSSQQPVAVKELKQRGLTFDELVALSEVAALRAAGRHANLVTLLSVSLIPVPVSRGGSRSFLVMDLCENGSLLDAIERRAQGAAGGSFAETEIRGAMRDLLLALAHLHGDNGNRSIPLAHRDVKPENILIGPPPLQNPLSRSEPSSTRDLVCKLCDFGQAATLKGRRKLTAYVGTRWYRAPELLNGGTGDSHYSHTVDLWAAGCVMAELFLLRPLFPGSSDADQLFRISSVLGRGGSDVRGATGLALLFPKASPEAINVLKSLLQIDPTRRASATEVLSMPFFRPGLEETVLRATGSGQSKSAAGDVMLRAAAEEAQLSLEKDLEYVKENEGKEEEEGDGKEDEIIEKVVSGTVGPISNNVKDIEKEKDEPQRDSGTIHVTKDEVVEKNTESESKVSGAYDSDDEDDALLLGNNKISTASTSTLSSKTTTSVGQAKSSEGTKSSSVPLKRRVAPMNPFD